MYITEPILGTITQGVIFNCALATRYPSVAVHGIIITARCDLAHDKIPIVTYLPIVKLEDWLAVDGSDILADRMRRDFEGAKTDALKAAGLSPSIAQSQTLAVICDTFFPEGDKGKATQQNRRKLQKLQETEEFFVKADAGSIAVLDLFERFPGGKKSLIKELCLQKVSGHYFLPSIYSDDKSPGYVVLMREISSLSSETASSVARGMTFDDGVLPLGLKRTDEMAMPVAELISPAIEHLLQSFSIMFGRIGLQDIADAYVDSLIHTLPGATK